MKRTRPPVVASILFFACLAILAVPVASASDSTALHWLRVDAADAELVQSLGGAAQVLDYGSYLWVGVDAADAAELAPRATSPVADFTLDLGGVRVDPRVAEPSSLVPDAWRAARAADEQALGLVQWQGPMRAAWRTDLEAAGLQVVQSIYPYTSIVWGPTAARDTLVGRSGVRWTGAFEPAYKVLPRWRALGPEPVATQVMIVRFGDAAAVRDAIERLGATPRGVATIDHRFEIASFDLPGDRFADAARIPGVYSIQPVPTDGGLRSEMSSQVNVGGYDAQNVVFPGYPGWLATVGLSGAGVVMANVDGGVQQSHPDLAARMVGCTGTTCSSSSSGHGTHTAGIMAADGASGTTDGDGFLRGLGMAPGATLFEQVYSPWFTQAGGMLLLMKDSSQNGAVLSGNSWGPAGSPRGYDNDTLQVDIGVRDADPDLAGNQNFTYVLSFMNGNGGTSSQGTPDEAKNLFNIGSTKMRTGGGSQILEIDDLSANSAHGPALDGRTIPHMVAPGCSVDSTVPNNSYSLQCGTSMASPAVAGAVGLFFERMRGLGLGDPSPALVKAAFLPVAHNLEGHRDADGGLLGHPFDSKQGWGRMDAAAVLAPTQSVVYVDNPTVFDASGETWSQTYTVDDPTRPVRMMLVWTDAPGHGMGGSTPAWNNDLDLEVDADGSTYRGNVFGTDGYSDAGGTADGINNTEGVFLDVGDASSGSITVRVVAADINSDAIPGVGDDTDQDFSLVCYNCTGGVSSLIFANGFEEGNLSAWD
ncbi:MAG: S8 family serine peptidase [Acidobacteriota bacterium]